MAFYGGEDDVFQCSDHPSKRRRNGVCPACLRNRLSALCPDCATVRPCACSVSSVSSSSSSSSLSFNFSSNGRISNLIESEPPFRRSRSAAISFFRSSKRFSDSDSENPRKSSVSWWSVFWPQRSARDNTAGDEVFRRSRSVTSAVTGVREEVKSAGWKSKGWYFPSPMKVFRHTTSSKASKLVQERSPLHRG